MKIVILNECFLTNAHLERLRNFGQVEIFKDTDSEEKAIERLKDADVAVADMFIAPLNKKVLSSTERLEFISLNTSGFELIDLGAATQAGIRVSDTPGYSTEAVAEHTIALMFAVIRKIVSGDQKMREKPLQTDPGNKKDRQFEGFEVFGKTLGVIGLGAIGQRVAQICLALGMKVLAYNRSSKNITGVKQVSLEELLKESDVVSLNLALPKELENFISHKELSLMKNNTVLINTAQGKLVDTQALYQALKENKIGGAGLDVIAEWTKDNPLLKLNNVVFTPHSGWFTQEALVRMADIIVDNVESFAKGNPKNIIN